MSYDDYRGHEAPGPFPKSPFTDDDLKRLKECLKSLGEFRLNIYTKNGQEWFDIRALLTRLEAAEAYIADPYRENLIRWRKAAGKP